MENPLTRICMAVLLPLLLVTSTHALPLFFESYLNRRDILAESARPMGIKSPLWENAKNGQLAFLAELLVLYPKDTQIYFLGRDSEYLFDFARLVLAGTRDANRIHLLNISRSTSDSKNLRLYLNGNGISESNIKDGQKSLIVDTGFFGNIIELIKLQFPYELHKNILGQLLQSARLHVYPSSLVFQRIAFPSDLAADLQIADYELLPKRTNSSSEIAEVNGIYHPISRKRLPPFNWIYSYRSSRLRQDLVAFWQKPESRNKLNFFISQFAAIKRHVELHGNTLSGNYPTELSPIIVDAFTTDLRMIQKLNSFPATEPNLRFTPSGISLCVLTFNNN